MKLASLRRPRRLALLVILAAALLAAGPVTGASAYERPPTGKWTFFNLFDDTKRGAFVLGKKRRATVIKRLILVVGEDNREACGKRIKVAGKPKLRSWRRFNGRWAFARVSKGLFAPKPVSLKVDGRKRRGRLMVLFGETGRTAETGEVEYGDCSLRFYARKGG